MSAVVQPPPPIAPVTPHSGASSQRKPATRNKPRHSTTAGAPQRSRGAAPRASGNASGIEATSSRATTATPVVVVESATARVNRASKAKKPWFKRRTPRPPPSSEIEGRNTGTPAGTGFGGGPGQQKPVEPLPTSLEIQQPQPVLKAQVKADAEQPDGAEDAKAAQPKRNKLNGEKKEKRDAKKKEKKEAHFNLVLSAAQATIAALAKYDLSCAVFGSLACKLYGSARYPKDVDLLVLQPPSDSSSPIRTAEEIKILILDADPRHFYLKLPRDPEAPYRILYYRDEYLDTQCKVDVLIPGIMNLPYIPPATPLLEPSARGNSNGHEIDGPSKVIAAPPRSPINIISGIPLVPFSLLLLHKLQGWDDHRTASEEFKQRKQVQDAADIRRLLALEEKMQELRSTRPWSDQALFSEEFQQLTRTRVKEYCKVFPTRATPWELLGFETGQDITKGEREMVSF